MANQNQEDEINRKRKNSHDYPIRRSISDEEEEEEYDEDDDFLTLSLSFPPSRPPRLIRQQQPSLLLLPSTSPSPSSPPLPLQLNPQYPLQLQPSQPLYIPLPPSTPSINGSFAPRAPRVRRNNMRSPRPGKTDKIPAPFPWAKDSRAKVHSLEYLFENGITTISGNVQCKRCEKQYEIHYQLHEKFIQVGTFIANNIAHMHDRAPSVWMSPVFPPCKYCDQDNAAKPIIADKKKSINWLFLLLGQTLGCCTLEQLKYFCKHTQNHRTGAKDRVLYLTYLALCYQLDPKGPFLR